MSTEAEGLRNDEEAVLRARAAALAQPNAEDAGEDIVSLIPFSVAGQPYAVPVDGVRQVRRLTGIARIPRSPASLLGITRIHSTVLPVFDLPALLEVASGTNEEVAWVLVLGDGDRPELGIAAQAVDGVRSVARDAIVEPVGAAQEGIRTWGVTPDGVTVLDVPALMAAPPVFATGKAQPASVPAVGPGEPGQPSTQRGQE